MDLFVRAGHNDNRVIDELVAPATAGIQIGPSVPMRALVIDAPTAVAQPAFRTTAEAAGLPLLVDPLTVLLQDEQPEGHNWAALEFATPDKLPPEAYSTIAPIDALVERCITFQIEHGASVVIPPYFHVKSPEDPWFQVQLTALSRAAAYLRAEGINLPVAPVFAASLQRFGPQASWSGGVDEFVRRIEGMNVRYVPMAMSSSRSPKGDRADRLASYLGTVRHLSGAAPTIAWRQGQYGLAAVAAGAAGYQTGPGIDERCDLPEFQRNRRPTDRKSGGGGGRRVYLAEFGRSVSQGAAEALLSNNYMRGTLTCNDPARCCPDGATSMVDSWKHHALRARSRELDELREMPNAAWRLNAVARKAERAADDTKAANEILAKAGIRERLHEASFRSVASVTDAIRAMDGLQAG